MSQYIVNYDDQVLTCGHSGLSDLLICWTEKFYIGDKVSLRESIIENASQAGVLLICRRKSSRSETIEVPFESIMSVANARSSSIFHSPFRFSSRDRHVYVCWLPKAERDTQLFVSYIRRRQYSRVYSRGSRSREYSFLSRIWASSFLFFSSSSFSYPPFCLQQSLATHPLLPPMPRASFILGRRLLSTPDFDSRNFASSRSFVRSRPHESPDPAILRCFRNPLSPSSLVYELPDSFPSLCRLSLSPGISFEHIGRKSTSPVVNGSPWGRRSARHSSNKETLSSGLYSTLCLSSQGNHYRYYFRKFLTFCSSQCV